VIGVTGHRDLMEKDLPRLERAVREQLGKIQGSYPNTPFIVASPLAEGADRLVARIALELKMQLVVPLPFDRAAYSADFGTVESRDEFAALLSNAIRVFEVALPPGVTNETVAAGGADRDRQYDAVGAWIAKHSQILLALWDGTESSAVGGTSSVVNLKLAGRSPDGERPEDMLDAPECGPVFQIITPRRSNRLPIGELFSCRPIYPKAGPISGEQGWTEILDRIATVNEEVHDAFTRTIPEVTQSRSDEAGERALPQYCVPLLNRYAIADVMAKANQRRRRVWLRLLFALALAGVGAFVVYDDVLRETVWASPMLCSYIAIFAIAYCVFFFGLSRQYERNFLEYRALAEGLRVQLYWLLLGFDAQAADYYLRRQRTELDWIRVAIRNCVLPIARPPATSPVEHVELVSKMWVARQLAYYKGSGKEKEERAAQVNRTAAALVTAALVTSVILAAWHAAIAEKSSLHNGFTIAIVMLLAVAGTIKGYAEKAAFSEESKQYQRMAVLFGRCSSELPELISLNKLFLARTLLVELGKEALRENGDWVLLHRARPAEVPSAG